MKKVYMILGAFTVYVASAHAYAQGCDDVELPASPDANVILLTDESGMEFTDLMMAQGKPICGISRTPKLDLKTLMNAKLACEARNMRLPYVSEVNNLASHISINYLLEKKHTDRNVLNARFMNEPRPIWTSTVEQDPDPYHYKRALVKLTHLASSSDMSKAKVEWVGTHLDNREERPYICVKEKQ